MASVGLASIERVDPRNVWLDESRDFTPWLREHVGVLGEALGLELEATGREVAVGTFAADIVGRELTTGADLLVENQLDATDHAHLGQLITYAGGLGARVIVWIAREFRPEHRRALDWLNEITPEGVGFFGVELEVFRIADSPLAPHFKVVTSPNEWQKATQSQANAPSTRELGYQGFWKLLIGELRRREPSSTTADPERAGTQNWFGIGIGRSGFPVNFVFAWPTTTRVELYIDTGDKARNETAFDLLHTDREVIESEVGEALTWDRRDDIQASRVYLSRTGSIDDDDETLRAVLAWGAERMLRLRTVFGTRVRALNLSTLPAEQPAVSA